MPKIYERRVGGVQNAIYGDFQVPYSAYFWHALKVSEKGVHHFKKDEG